MTGADGLDVAGLLCRLEAAERVCAAYAIAGASLATDREKATHELWRVWADGYWHLVTSPDDLEVLRLAVQGDTRRAHVTALLRAQKEGP